MDKLILLSIMLVVMIVGFAIGVAYGTGVLLDYEASREECCKKNGFICIPIGTSTSNNISGIPIP